jgi:hypothetical protein
MRIPSLLQQHFTVLVASLLCPLMIAQPKQDLASLIIPPPHSSSYAHPNLLLLIHYFSLSGTNNKSLLGVPLLL